MAKESMKAKHRLGGKFEVRNHNRCAICGRPRGFMRRFDMCRLCFRKLANEGKLPGVTKSSW
jgi:small subunit ribosomal protein S14